MKGKGTAEEGFIFGLKKPHGATENKGLQYKCILIMKSFHGMKTISS